jgi:hypothetical protein
VTALIVIDPFSVRPSALSVNGYKSKITQTTTGCDGCGKRIEQALFINGKKFCSAGCYKLTAYALNGWGL